MEYLDNIRRAAIVLRGTEGELYVNIGKRYTDTNKFEGFSGWLTYRKQDSVMLNMFFDSRKQLAMLGKPLILVASIIGGLGMPLSHSEKKKYMVPASLGGR